MKIKLWDEKIPYYQEDLDTPNSMTAYLTATWYDHPAVIIYPGGGYAGREAHEGAHIAQFYQSKGFQAFVVDYRLYPNRFEAILADAQRAIKVIRKNARQYRVDPNKIFVAGFSAGGHLAACTATMEDISKIGDSYDDVDARPTGAILGYPVILANRPDGEIATSIRRLVSETYPASSLSLEKRVTQETPPCFLWHTFEDTTVDMRNSLSFAEALKTQGVHFEMHIFPKGKHGLGLAQLYPDVGTWPEMSVQWMLRNF